MPLSQESSSSSSSDLSAHSTDAPVYSPVSNFSLSDYSSNLEEGSEQLHDDQEQNQSPESLPLPEAGDHFGYKFVGDNVDKNVRPSRERAEMKPQSLHYFHSFAVKDRVPIDGLSDKTPEIGIPDPVRFLPSTDDIDCIKQDLCILISR